MEISVTKQTDLAKIISSAENVSVEEGKVELERVFPKIKEVVLHRADLFSIYFAYEAAKNRAKSPEEIKKIKNKKSFELVNKISDFENISSSETIKKLKNTKLYQVLMDKNSEYWMKPVLFMFNDYLIEIGYKYVEDDGYIEDAEFAKIKKYNK